MTSMRHRYYEPQTGRFTSFDRFEAGASSPQDLHKYLYCRNNPVNAIDPSGHFTLVELGVTIFIIALLTAIVLVGLSKARGAAALTRLQANVQQAVVAMSSMNSISQPTPALLPPFDATLDVGDSTFGPSSAGPPGFIAAAGTLVGGPGNAGPLNSGAYLLPYKQSSTVPQPYIGFVAHDNDDAPVLVYNRGAFDELQRRRYLSIERQTNDMSKIAIFVQEGWSGTSAGKVRSHWIAKYAGGDSGITLDHYYNVNIDVQSMWLSTGSAWQPVKINNGAKPVEIPKGAY
jgi:type II secretory pathway pseudopilin PulG